MKGRRLMKEEERVPREEANKVTNKGMGRCVSVELALNQKGKGGWRGGI